VQIAPRYGDPPVMRIESLMDDPAPPLLRQRTRLAARLSGLDDVQWATPSRCQGWSVQDVVAHLTTTNQFWAVSVTSARAGAPTRFLEGFDPVVVPAQMVDDARSWTPAQTLDRFTRSNQDLADAVAGLDADGWARPAEAPPGHLSIRLVAMHALWDAWIHERDIVLPLGLDPVHQPDEIAGALAYVAALGPAFLALNGSTRAATIDVAATDPDLHLVVEVGATVLIHDGSPFSLPAADAPRVTLAGPAVDLVEGLSFRVPLNPSLDPDDRWVLGDLGRVFDQAP
jgi:uncharacterized protein (TIGR03083 family)